MIVKNQQNENSSNKIIREKYDIPLKTQRFVLQMTMAQWDGQWFLKSKKEFGIEKANYLNQRVVSSIGRIESKHILNALGIRKGSITSISEVFKVINTIMEVMIPKIMKFKFIANSKSEGDAIVKKCFIWEEVKKSKKENEYTCACNFRHRGWLEAMGVNGEIIAEKRFCNGDECCKFKFIMN